MCNRYTFRAYPTPTKLSVQKMMFVPSNNTFAEIDQMELWLKVQSYRTEARTRGRVVISHFSLKHTGVITPI